MSNAEIAAWELDKKLDGRSLHYKIEDAPHCENHNERSFDTIKEMLERVGVNLEKDDDSLFISINSQKYAAAARTYAGRGRRFAYPKNEYKAYTYSDIVYMLNSMSNDEVAAKIDMPIATFYRHKKRGAKPLFLLYFFYYGAWCFIQCSAISARRQTHTFSCDCT